MKRASLTMRMPQSTREALEIAAEEDMRSVSNMVEKILTEWLIDHDYLSADDDFPMSQYGDTGVMSP